MRGLQVAVGNNSVSLPLLVLEAHGGRSRASSLESVSDFLSAMTVWVLFVSDLILGLQRSKSSGGQGSDLSCITPGLCFCCC